MVNFYIDKKKSKRGEYRWRAIARNGRIVADSAESYKNEADCRHGFMVALQEMLKHAAKILDRCE